MSSTQADQQLLAMHAALQRGTTVPDDVIRQAIKTWHSYLQTSCDLAAELLFAAVAPVCHYRPSLTREMLMWPLRPLFYLGIDRAEDVMIWVDNAVRHPSSHVRLGAIGCQWLATVFPSLTELVQSILDELIREAEEDGQNPSPEE